MCHWKTIATEYCCRCITPLTRHAWRYPGELQSTMEVRHAAGDNIKERRFRCFHSCQHGLKNAGRSPHFAGLGPTPAIYHTNIVTLEEPE